MKLSISENSIPLAVEDKFMIVGIGDARNLGPDLASAELLAEAFQKREEKYSFLPSV